MYEQLIAAITKCSRVTVLFIYTLRSSTLPNKYAYCAWPDVILE